MKINTSTFIKQQSQNYSLPNIDYDKLSVISEASENSTKQESDIEQEADIEVNEVADYREKKFSVQDLIDEEKENLSLVLQPALKTEIDLETNMFAPYPTSNIPFANSTSWIGM